MMITKMFTFDSAHRLFNPKLSDEENKNIFGKCFNLHGHTYKLNVSVDGKVNSETGMIINFVDLKRIVTETVLDVLDHKYLNELSEFEGMITTCENMIIWIWFTLYKELPCLSRLELYETPTSFATLKSDEILASTEKIKTLNLNDNLNLKETK